MKKTVISISFFLILSICAQAQEIKLMKYELRTPPVIGTSKGETIHEGGITGLHFIRGSKNEFYLITDRGPNADASEANAGKETILFPFPDYAPKIFKVRAEGDSLRIVEILKLKKSDGTNASGIPHPVGLGNTGEVAWVDTNKTLANLDEWGIDSECIAADSNGDFWIGEEYGPTIWRVNGKTGEVIKRYTPFFASAHEVTIDSIMAKRRPNRGFEGIACTPNGKVYARNILAAKIDFGFQGNFGHSQLSLQIAKAQPPASPARWRLDQYDTHGALWRYVLSASCFNIKSATSAREILEQYRCHELISLK